MTDRVMERMISRHLRANPIRVEASPVGIQRRIFSNRVGRTGMVVGIANGCIRVVVDGNRTPSSFHPTFWRKIERKTYTTQTSHKVKS